MEIIGKISKGTKMDQVYISKNRYGFNAGDYVVITPIKKERIVEKPYFYKTKNLEPIKLKIIEEIFNIILESISICDNIIITGSFLDKGFNFNDVDIVIVTDEKCNIYNLTKDIEDIIGIKAHIILLNKQVLIKGLSLDPLYQMMIDKCVSKNRLIYKLIPEINYKILDLHLLKSKTLIENFDVLNGNEKYYLTRNLFAIHSYINGELISKDLIDSKIEKYFNLNNILEIKQNLLNKKIFINKYKLLYNKLLNKIMKGIKNGAKQK